MISRSLALGAMIPVLASGFYLAATPARADLVLETETAQIGKKGQGNISNAFQVEKDADGKTYLTESQFEYGVNDRTEILIEPFFYEKQMPNGGPSTSGVGDLEVTLSYMVMTETANRPAILLAEKVKIPTATNRDIGTGKADFQSYVIVGKTIGGVEFNLNLGYEFVGKTDTADLKSQVIYDISADFPVGERTTLFAEAFGNTSPEYGVTSTNAVSVGAEYQISQHVNAFVAVGDDTDDRKVGRIGFNYGW